MADPEIYDVVVYVDGEVAARVQAARGATVDVDVAGEPAVGVELVDGDPDGYGFPQKIIYDADGDAHRADH